MWLPFGQASKVDVDCPERLRGKDTSQLFVLQNYLEAGRERGVVHREDSLLGETKELRGAAYDADFDCQQASQKSHDNCPVLEQQLDIETCASGHEEQPQEHTSEGPDICFLQHRHSVRKRRSLLSIVPGTSCKKQRIV